MHVLHRAKQTLTLSHDSKQVTYTHAGRGFEYLEELLCHPLKPIMCSHLRQLFQIDPNNSPKDDFREVEADTIISCPKFPFLPLGQPIEVADKQTIEEVKSRLVDLINEEEDLMQYHDLARLEDVRDEKQALMDYLKKAMTPMQKPKYLHHQQRNDYSAVKKAIQRAISKMQPDFPILAKDLNENLDYGLSVCYKKAS